MFATDLDGVLANPYSQLEKRIIKKTGSCRPFHTWHDPALENLFPELHESWVREQFSDPAFWENVEIFEDSLDWLNEQSKNHKIHIVTARFDKVSVVTLDWLKKTKVQYTNIVHVPREMKVEALRAIKPDFMIEDDPRNAYDISMAGIKTYLITRPYNIKHDIGKSIRIESLKEIDVG